jgi:SAM-dependent methyltransferase
VKAGARCTGCGTDFPALGGVPSLVPEPARKLADWRRQVARMAELNERSLATIDEQLKRFDLLPATRQRIEKLRVATVENAERVVGLFSAAGLEPDPRAKAGDGDFNIIEYYEHILRDWAWDRDGTAENGRALAQVKDAIGAEPLGRMLVLGAGPARLAYDLAIAHQPALTVALDLSPLLLLAARRIIFDGGLRLHEFPAEPRQGSLATFEHALSAPQGPPPRFHLLLADAFTPPLRRGVFDTVVTPWFIDIVPVDVRVTLALIHGLLKPGGRWINYGPLAYPSGHAHGQRYTPDELFELIGLAGFDRGETRVERIEFMSSPVAAHAKISQVISFAARKLEPLPAPPDLPAPAWLLLSHLPIPRFPGLDAFVPEHPLLAYLKQRIDGRATLADLAAMIIKDHGARPDAALEGTRAMLGLIVQAVQAPK